MVKRNIKSHLAIISGIIAALLLSVAAVFAQQFNSTNYSINEAFIGTGGSNDISSTNFSARATLGETAVGEVDSTNFKAFGGFETTDEPFIELTVPAATIDMGLLSETATGTGTATFTVRTWLASGYSVTIAGGTLTNESGDTITALTSGGTTSQGDEQFGLNLRANSGPPAQGTAVNNVFAFSNGQVAANYNIDNTYRYNEGEQVAFSNSSSGETTYTISYLANVDELTEGGLYTTNHTIVATSTF